MYQQPINNYCPTNRNYQSPMIAPNTNLKGHPVTSLEEVKASSIDFDGTISYFPDMANNCIYTKQINLDGTVLLKKYGIVELPNENTIVNNDNYITREEFEKALQELKNNLLPSKNEGEGYVFK